MYKNVLASIPGIEWYPIIALVLFFGFFSALLIWFVLVDKNRLQHVSSTALDDGIPAGHSSPSPSTGE